MFFWFWFYNRPNQSIESGALQSSVFCRSASNRWCAGDPQEQCKSGSLPVAVAAEMAAAAAVRAPAALPAAEMASGSKVCITQDVCAVSEDNVWSIDLLQHGICTNVLGDVTYDQILQLRHAVASHLSLLHILTATTSRQATDCRYTAFQLHQL